MNLYNEIDPHAAAILRSLIAADLIPPGVVDERDIRDLTPEYCSRFIQCHFFAGIGGWPLALAYAGWPADRPIWTGSCPCQPFSAAGKGDGFEDERHLWPDWHWLIDQCRPAIVTGEQVASKDGLGWLDLVQADMEGSAYAFGAADLCAAGITVQWQDSQAGEWLQRAIRDCGDPIVAGQLRDFADWAGGNLGEGSPHMRQRLYFVGVGDGFLARLEGHGRHGDRGRQPGRIDAHQDRPASTASAIEWLGNCLDIGCEQGRAGVAPQERDDLAGNGTIDILAPSERSCPPNQHWRNADWLLCRDEYWRPVEPESFPLVDGLPSRVAALRGYGNAIVPEVGAAFIKEVMDVIFPLA